MSEWVGDLYCETKHPSGGLVETTVDQTDSQRASQCKQARPTAIAPVYNLETPDAEAQPKRGAATGPEVSFRLFVLLKVRPSSPPKLLKREPSRAKQS